MSGSITINSNLASLKTQRLLSDSTAMLSRSLARLSSGLRINRASDDAAGLAISGSLRTDTRVFTQGLRNLNDGVSLLQIAEGALKELSSIFIREGELAEQAANGTLSLTQRRALNGEANALKEEFNRIVSSTAFNNQKLLDLSITGLRIQSSYGTNGSLSFALGDKLSRVVGDGTFQDPISQDTGYLQEILSADFDKDGNLDVVSTSGRIFLGNGNGTFKAGTALPGSGQGMAAADLNGDDNLDIACVVGGLAGILLGDGHGGFSLGQAVNIDSGGTSIAAADFNGDGIPDLATSNSIANKVNILFGHGDGTFGQDIGGGEYAADASYAVAASPSSIAIGDFNGDGVKDIATGSGGAAAVSVLINGGNGSFSRAVSYAAVATQTPIVAGDLNADGISDIVAVGSASSGAYVLLGRDDGSLKAPVAYNTGGGPWGLGLGDLNGDAVLDIVTANYGSIDSSLLIGRGDGTFADATSGAVASPPCALTLGDFNNDGALDTATAGVPIPNLEAHLANPTRTTTIGRYNLNSREHALQAMALIDGGLERVTSELSAIGAAENRLASAVSNLHQVIENYTSAESRITDADVAEESARIVKSQILQQASVSILSQANQAPDLALLLLGQL